ncbi:MAG: hypothetical protein FWD24_07580 [Treponema sp.]|nr:hypothetical protein [Treponema sp.]
MKKTMLIFFLLIVSLSVYAQRIPSVGVIPFGISGGGVTAADAANLTNRVVNEFTSWGTLTVTQDTAGAEYIVRGTLSRQGGNFVLNATTTLVSSGQVLNQYNEQAQVLNDISIPMFCAKAVERVPLPNYLLGTWQASITMPDGPVVCVIEFRSDRTVRVERFDTWEHRQNNALRYEGYGTGTYTYAGFANRNINVGGRQIRVDATISVNLTLEETLPDQASVNQSGISLVFNGDRTSFEIVNGMLQCGRNFDGPSVYHSDVLGFTQFRKIR